MATLRETKDRIASVRGTLKITSAMKMIASSKLHKAQQAAATTRAYRTALEDICSKLPWPSGQVSSDVDTNLPVAIVAFASDSSLCGAFNSNIIRVAAEEIKRAGAGVKIFAVGRKMAEALAKQFPEAGDVAAPISPESDYDSVSAFADSLAAAYNVGEYSRIVLVYNHFVSAASQKPLVEDFLPLAQSGPSVQDQTRGSAGEIDSSTDDGLYLFEPAPEELSAELLPKLIRLKLYSVCLDSYAAECAARTLAMQLATDNAQDLLAELTLEYNKQRQYKITAEILDLAAGAEATL
ncbi:MAG: ATP synthase F1 subunit gamma [Bacteroidales bacterium]|nr:ATP synthase F1 subunit gamma [Bacteroidales bacterium]